MTKLLEGQTRLGVHYEVYNASDKAIQLGIITPFNGSEFISMAPRKRAVTVRYLNKETGDFTYSDVIVVSSNPELMQKQITNFLNYEVFNV